MEAALSASSSSSSSSAAVLVRVVGSLARVRLGYGALARRHVMGAGLAVPSRRRLLVASLPKPHAPLSLAQEADEGMASPQILPPHDVVGKTVRVRFVLRKQCAFGQRFLLVGGDPALGLWDPAKAVVLDWSEDHVWTAQKDLPANKLIEFKFLLQDSSGKLHWQEGSNRTLQTSCNRGSFLFNNFTIFFWFGQDLPANKLIEFKFLVQASSGKLHWQEGSNRALQTNESANTLVVYEDWVDARNQKIVEEGVLPIDNMEEVGFLGDGDGDIGAIVTDELETDESQEANKTLSVGVDENQEAKEVSSVSMDDKKSAIVADASLHMESVEESEANQRQLILDEGRKPQSELHEKADVAPQDSNAADDCSERTDDDSIFSEEDVPMENGPTSTFGIDFLWGWKALQQLLMILGFRMDTTET